MLTQIRKNKMTFANNVLRTQGVLNGCIPSVSVSIDGANTSASLMPVLAGGRVETPCYEVAEYRAEVPPCSRGTVVPTPVATCDFSSIPGLTTNLNAADPAGNGVLPADGSPVTTWADVSSSANPATLPAGTNPPTFQLVSQNGLPGIVFTNSAVAPFQTLTIPNATNTLDYTIFIVGSFADTTFPLVSIASLMSPLVAGAAMEFFPVAILMTQPLNSHIAFINWLDPIVSATPYILTTVIGHPNMVYGVNGNDITAGLPLNPPPAPPVNAYMSLAITNKNGAFTHPASVVINQILIYNRDLTVTEYKRVEACLSQKWGIPVI